MSKSDKEKIYFGGYFKPNYTMVPDELFDRQLPHLSGSQLKVLLYILRRTFGFKKDSDAISLSQICTGITTRDGRVLDLGTGLTRRLVIEAAKALVEMGLIVCERRQSPERGFEATVYSLNLSSDLSATLVPKRNQGASAEREPGLGSKKEPGLVPKGNQQETGVQKTVLQKTDEHLSNIRKVKPGQKGQGRQAVNGTAPKGPEGVGAILARSSRQANPPAGKARAGAASRSEAGDEDFQRIQSFIMDRQRELGDRASPKSSTTRAWNLYQASGKSIARFEQALFKARALTQESTAQITAVGDDPNYDLTRKIKMPYFFAVLEDVLGLRTEEHKAAQQKAIVKGQAARQRRARDDTPSHHRVPYTER